MQKIISRISVGHLKQAYHAELKQQLGNVEVLRRLERAYDMLTRDSNYSIEYVSGRGVSFKVTSPNDTYTVIPAQRLCTCPDSALLCKHRLAVKLILDAIKLQVSEGFTITQNTQKESVE